MGNIAILPLRTQSRGPAPMANIEQDIIDESLYYFKANVFFRTYEVKVMIDILVKSDENLRKMFILVGGRSNTYLHNIVYYRMLEKTAKMQQ